MEGIEFIGISPALPPLALERIPDGATAGPPAGGEPPTRPVRDMGDEVSSAHRHDERKRQLARDFESVLLARLFDQVKESIGPWSVDEEDDGTSQQVHGLFWLYLAQDVADKGGLGLWQDIYQHFNAVEGAPPAGNSIDGRL